MTCVDHGKTGNKDGYAQINRKGFYALHRLVYAEAHGLSSNDLTGVVIRHTCDNARCINPDHLIRGTWADNNRDRAERGRSAKTRHDKRKLTDEQVDYIRTHLVVGCKENGCDAMARRFNLDRKTIYLIRKGRTYFQ